MKISNMKILLLSQYDKSQATTRIRLISIQNELKKIGYSSTVSYLINWNYKKQPAFIGVIIITFLKDLIPSIIAIDAHVLPAPNP